MLKCAVCIVFVEGVDMKVYIITEDNKILDSKGIVGVYDSFEGAAKFIEQQFKLQQGNEHSWYCGTTSSYMIEEFEVISD